jgi:dolichyl-phosphate beta-glucosyltransferase
MTTDRAGGLSRYLVAGGLYLVLSVGVWWHAWSAGPSTVMTCDCTDAGRMVWYLAWSGFALDHGHQLLFSNWLFHPTGFNLLNDTSAPAITLVLSPVTLLWGPVTAINVASTLVPVVTALSMFWLLQRWVRWAPAAFVGGLAYGFSAAVIVQLSFGWLNLACTALLPLMVACLDELLIRQRARPVRVGAALAVLVAVEFFVSTEVVLLATVSAVVATVLVVGYAALRHPYELRRRARYALVGLGATAVVGAVLLAYPVWFFMAGPAHLGGMVWSSDVPGNLGNTIGNLWTHFGQYGPISAPELAKEVPALGGYRGPASPSPSYLGPGVLVVVIVGIIVWRKDRRLWLFGSLGVITVAMSLRVGAGRWAPWSLVHHLPLFDNVVQSRFDAVFGLCAAVMVAVVVDRSRTGVGEWLEHRRAGWTTGAGWWAGAVGAAVALAALIPVIAVLAPNLPLTLQPVTVPRWFLTTADHLPPGQVLATYPFATADSQAPIPWQAIGGMHFAMAGGGGPAGTVARAGDHGVAFAVLRSASVPLLPPPVLTAPNLTAVRSALRAWGVTMVVVPNDTGLPTFLIARGTGYGVAFFTAVLGSAPTYQNGAWVWTGITHRPAATAVPSAAFSACVARPAGSSAGDDPWAACVLQASLLSSGQPG